MRATVVEVAARAEGLRQLGGMPQWRRQLMALEALQIYAPLGHALGLKTVSAEMEDRSFKACISALPRLLIWMGHLAGCAKK